MDKKIFKRRSRNLSRLAVTAVFGWTSIVSPVFAQAPAPDASKSPPALPDKIPEATDKAPAAPVAPAPVAPAAPAAPAVTGQTQVPPAKIYSISDLEYLLAPIALYPDPLLALIFSASAFPLEIVQADRWIDRNPAAIKNNDFSQIDAMQIDGSVQALARFPDTIALLSDHLEWTRSLGMAFAVQPADVSATVQMLRARAESVGNLKTTPEQVVTVREEEGARTIYILPANPERIYVPVYNPNYAFDRAMTGALLFGSGILVGSLWNNRWGWNDRRWNQVVIHQHHIWQNPPPNWRPPHGGWHPGRPGGGRPNARPERPGGRPGAERPSRRPGAERPGRPDGRPNVQRPGARPDGRPNVQRPQRQRPEGQRPQGQRPQVQRPQGQRPQVQRPQGQRPQVQRPQGQRPQARPQTRPQNRPQARPNRPQARPQARPQNRPQNRPARPQVRDRSQLTP